MHVIRAMLTILGEHRLLLERYQFRYCVNVVAIGTPMCLFCLCRLHPVQNFINNNCISLLKYYVPCSHAHSMDRSTFACKHIGESKVISIGVYVRNTFRHVSEWVIRWLNITLPIPSPFHNLTAPESLLAVNRPQIKLHSSTGVGS